MTKKIFFLVLLFIGLGSYAQNAISGHINIEDNGVWEQKVHLVKIDDQKIEVAISPIKKNGFFSFHKKHISEKNTMYRIYVNRVQKIINDTLVREQKFILSNKDSIRFEKGMGLFTKYTNSNPANAEWLRLRKYEARLQRSFSDVVVLDSSTYMTQMTSYAKDSLKILMVKLIGIRQLENKDLLDQDIAKNPTYYLTLLQELKASNLNHTDYLFLEKKLAFLTNELVEQKYQQSKAVNWVLGLLVAGLLFIVFMLKRKKNPVLVDLSRQEKNIQELILAGKSNKEIANELFISLSTVKTHITNIYSKLQVSNRQELLKKTQNS